jgi:hypothetical protein
MESLRHILIIPCQLKEVCNEESLLRLPSIQALSISSQLQYGGLWWRSTDVLLCGVVYLPSTADDSLEVGLDEESVVQSFCCLGSYLIVF